MAGRMVLADDDQPRVMAVDPRSCRPGRRSAVDVHPRWRAAAQAGGDAVGAGRAGLREEAAAVDERTERCEHHMARADVDARGPDGGVVEPFVDGSRPRVLAVLSAVACKSA